MPLNSTQRQQFVRLCDCGCGQPTLCARQTWSRLGYQEGEPQRFIHNHHMNVPDPRREARRLARFWERVEKTDDHWWWRGAFVGRCYGRLGHDMAHRLSWEIHNGTIPEGLDVMHVCDTPPCVNPTHLRLGSHQENMDDMVAKGRADTVRGEENEHAKLTDEQVRQIYRRARKTAWHKGNEGESHTALAREFGVSVTVVTRIVRRTGWKHLELTE